MEAGGDTTPSSEILRKMAALSYLLLSYLIIWALKSLFGPKSGKMLLMHKKLPMGGAVYMSLKVRSKLIIVDSVLPNRTHEIQYIVPTSVVA